MIRNAILYSYGTRIRELCQRSKIGFAYFVLNFCRNPCEIVFFFIFIFFSELSGFCWLVNEILADFVWDKFPEKLQKALLCSMEGLFFILSHFQWKPIHFYNLSRIFFFTKDELTNKCQLVPKLLISADGAVTWTGKVLICRRIPFLQKCLKFVDEAVRKITFSENCVRSSLNDCVLSMD